MSNKQKFHKCQRFNFGESVYRMEIDRNGKEYISELVKGCWTGYIVIVSFDEFGFWIWAFGETKFLDYEELNFLPDAK